MTEEQVVIVAAYRTPTGKFWGQLQPLNSVQLASRLVQAMFKQLEFSPQIIDQVILGNVLATGAGQNLARQVQINTGLPQSGTAMTINQVCGSSLKALRLAQAALLMGDSQAVLAGGVESMSNAVAFAPRTAKNEFQITAWQDSLQEDGLKDAFGHYAMGKTAENLAQKYHITRQQQDQYACQSQQRAALAAKQGWFNKEILPINDLQLDEPVRPNTNLEVLGQLSSVYQANGSVTAGNSSPLSDGASALILMTESKAQALGIKPLARICGYQEVGYRPDLMGYTPVIALQKLLEQKHQQVSDIDLFEVNEAFAAQALVVQQKLQINNDKYNISGGALALGHALGSSGSRIVTTLVHNLQRRRQQYGIAALCIGGGQGIALEVENLQ
ncbi:thiolase family protein [Bombilactobacillus bombi]|uniref:thiolase family protein n=1 Tax=Bombilactobacillus bombi TaxID=1303590 RepID=UPI0015E5BDB7|nr:thiolase family protein [Bombilactobacillus bombi]MBA1434785.1 thiolase family protein [Bombilactobacillus bombi]